MTIGLDTVLLGLGLFYLVELVRKLPLIEKLVFRGVRPFACHICMSGWAAIAAHALFFFAARGLYSQWWQWMISAAVSAGVCLLALCVQDALAAGSKDFDVLPGRGV